VADFFDIVFWPCAMDFKYDDVRTLADAEITLTLFNGAIRSSENYEMAKLLRQKSVLLCAFGSCASDGGIPGLANLTSAEAIQRYVYEDSPSTVNPEKVRPRRSGRSQPGRCGCRTCGIRSGRSRRSWTWTTSFPAARRSPTGSGT